MTIQNRAELEWHTWHVSRVQVWYEQPESEDRLEDIKDESLKVEERTGSAAALSKEAKAHDYHLTVMTLSKKGKIEGMLFI